MPKNYEILEQLKENVTLTGANAFTEVELTLLEEIGKRKQSKRGGQKIKCMMVWGIALELVSDCAIFDGAGVDHEDTWFIQFTTNTESAEVEMIDKDVFFKYAQIMDDATAVGFEVRDKILYIWFPQPLPYIKKRLWVGAGSTGLATALDINFTIFHTYGYVSQYQLNRMIAKKI